MALIRLDNNEPVHLIRLEQPGAYPEVHPLFPTARNPLKALDVGAAAACAAGGAVLLASDQPKGAAWAAFAGAVANGLGTLSKPRKVLPNAWVAVARVESHEASVIVRERLGAQGNVTEAQAPDVVVASQLQLWESRTKPEILFSEAVEDRGSISLSGSRPRGWSAFSQMRETRPISPSFIFFCVVLVLISVKTGFYLRPWADVMVDLRMGILFIV